MIKLTRLKGKEFIINCEQIEKMESNPDTTITMMNGHVYIVKETLEEIIDKIFEYKKNFNFLGFQKE